MIDKFTILFCCQKAFIKYMEDNIKKIKCLFQESVGRKYLAKVQLLDTDMQNKFQSSVIPSNIYVIDIKIDNEKNILTDKCEQVNNYQPTINLKHMGVVLSETDDNYDTDTDEPHLNIHNICVLCFISCTECLEINCPGKSVCSKLAMDVIRLWEIIQYKPEYLSDAHIKAIKEGIQMMYYNRNNALQKQLPHFLQKEINSWE